MTRRNACPKARPIAGMRIPWAMVKAVGRRPDTPLYMITAPVSEDEASDTRGARTAATLTRAIIGAHQFSEGW
ncbi:hypothetical protein ACFWZT_18735 [Streptomyces alboflavus]|uniref:hypothetical protein n=1 Tax=Streptomyces alboflavus TaxID=67267 RepID=UPI003686DAEC